MHQALWPFCGEEELVRQVHTLFGRNAQVVHELQVREEMEGVRQEVRDVEGGEQGEEKRSHEHEHADAHSAAGKNSETDLMVNFFHAY